MASAPSPALPELILYTREDCELCDEARVAIGIVLDERGRSGRPVPALREVDIGVEEDLERRYGERVPVVVVGDEHLDLVVGARRLARLMERVLDGVTAG